MATYRKKTEGFAQSNAQGFRWVDVGVTNIKKLSEELNDPPHITGIEKKMRYNNRKLFALAMAVLLLVQMQPIPFAFADDGADTPKAETTASEEVKKAEPAAEPKPEPKPEPKAEPKAEPKQEPAAESAEQPADAGKSETDSSAAEQSETAKEDAPAPSDQAAAEDKAAEEQPAPEEEKKEEEKKDEYPAQTLSANAGGVTVTLKAPEGALPEGSKLKAHQVGQKYIDAVAEQLEAQGRTLTDAVAIDVTPVNKDGKEIQPKKSVKVTFSGTGLDLEPGDSVDVFRVSDDASSVTDMGGSGNANSATFTTSHFSIYVTGTSPHEIHEQNTEAGRYKLAYNATVNLTDERGSSSAWTASTGSRYVELSDSSNSRITVKNINTTTTDQVVAIRHGSNSSSYRYFYITALAERFTVSYKFKDAGSSSFADDGSEDVIRGQAASQQPSHADKTVGGVTYKFDGWYTDEACSTPANLNSVSSNMTVYGQYKANKVTVTYDPKGGKIDGSTDPKTEQVDPGTDITLIAAPARDNYTFDGWKTGSRTYDPGVTYTVNGNVTFEAQWTPVEYTISYSYAGGTAPSTANPVKYTVEDNVSISNEPTRAGYTFTGWTGSGITTPQKNISWSEGEETGNKSYTANWTTDEYTISYDYDGGTEPSTANPVSYTVEDNVSISNEPTKTGYTFEGWTGDGITEPTKTVSWSAGDETGDKEYKANWKVIEYSITYSYADGTAPSTANPVKYTVEDNVSISNEPTKTGYTFTGWTGDGITEPTKTVSWSAGDKTGNKEFTANWEPTEYTITYDYDGGHEPGTANPSEYTVEDDVSITNEPTKDGYTFEGWTGSGITTPKKTISWSAGDETGDKEYKANWKVIEYSITYNYAGGTVPQEANPDKYTIEDDISISNEPTRDGYIFTGWTSFDTHPDITEPTTPVVWSAGDEVNNKTFTANWKKAVTLRYHKNTGDDQATLEPPEEEIILGAGDKITLATADYEGHHFEEWNTKEDGTGSHHDGGSEYTMPNHDVDLYAQWSEHPITVTYYYNYSGASEPYREVSAPENDDHYQVINDKPTRDEYLFAGWSETEGATDLDQIDYLPGAKLVTQEENINLYAVWVLQQHEERQYTQTLEGIGTEVYYTGEEQAVGPKHIVAKEGGSAYIGVTSVDNPKTSTGEDYKYAGYVRVGDKTDGDSAWHHLYAYVVIDSTTQIKGTDAGVYNGSSIAPLYAHREDTGLDGMERLTTTDSAGNTGPEFVEVTKNQLIIKPVPIAIETFGDKKAHDSTALTKGGKVVVGASDDDQVEQKEYTLNPGRNVIALRNGENVVIEITGSQTDVGSSKNDVVVHWSESTGDQHNYTVSKDLGTLTVYDFTAEFYKNTDDPVSGMPEDWEGDAPSRTYTLPSNEPTRAHSAFEGWTTNSAGTGTVYGPRDSYTYPEGETDVKFYAKWSAEVDVVTYDPNGGRFDGTTRPTEIACGYEEEHTIREAATRNYYDFAGWNTKQDGSGQSYDPGFVYTVTGDVTFYAQWTPREYTISYEYAGGDAPETDNPSKYTVEDDVSIANEPTRDNYTFEGWTGDGITTPTKTISWSAGEKNGNKTFTANWKAVEYNITYDYDGGTAPTTDNPAKYTVEDDVSISNEPTKTGYTFEGWTGDGITTPKKTISWSAGDENGDKSYKANWEPVEYTITYDYDGGTAPTTANPAKYTIEDDVSISNEPTKKGYTFEGWTGSGIDNPTQPISWNAGEETGDKEYKANWKAVEYNIAYDYDGGDAPEADNPSKYTVEDDVSISNEPTRSHYIFTGWTGSGIDDPTKTISWNAGEETGDKEYKANWDRIRRDVTYDPAGGTYKGKTEPTTTKEDEAATIKIGEKPTRKHFIFLGWEDEEGTLHQPGDDFTVPDNNVTFTAKWEPLQKITYDPNGGTFRDSEKPVDVEYKTGEAVEIAEAATRDHHIFKGWKDSEGKIYQPGDKDVEFSADAVLTAVWDKEVLKIYFDPNGGVFRGSEKTKVIEYEYGETITIPEAPTRDGYEFLYWKGSEYYPGDSYTVTEEHRFVAQWEAESKAAGSSTSKKGGDPGTGDSAPVQYFFTLILAMFMIALILSRRETNVVVQSETEQFKAQAALRTETEVIKLSDSINFRWMR